MVRPDGISGENKMESFMDGEPFFKKIVVVNSCVV
jgi:hypothetical protein